MSTVSVILDTNIFLHYQPIEQINWVKVLKSDTVTLIVPPIVVRELEPYHSAIQIRNSRDIAISGCRINGHVFPFENAVFYEITGMTIPYKFFTKLLIK